MSNRHTVWRRIFGFFKIGRKPVGYRLGSVTLNVLNGTIFRDGETIDVRGQVEDFLIYLAANADSQLSEDDVLERLWPNDQAARAVKYNRLRGLNKRTKHILGEDSIEWKAHHFRWTCAVTPIYKSFVSSHSGKQLEKQHKTSKVAVMRNPAPLVLALVLSLSLARTGDGGRQALELQRRNVMRILVADFDSQSSDKSGRYQVTATILKQLQQSTGDVTSVRIESLRGSLSRLTSRFWNLETDRTSLISEAKRRNATVLIWGSYDSRGASIQVVANIELLFSAHFMPKGFSHQEAVSISDLESFKLQGTLARTLDYLMWVLLGLDRYREKG